VSWKKHRPAGGAGSGAGTRSPGTGSAGSGSERTEARTRLPPPLTAGALAGRVATPAFRWKAAGDF
jgi:hypothetical protein